MFILLCIFFVLSIHDYSQDDVSPENFESEENGFRVRVKFEEEEERGF